ncbi:DsbA family oxidoreductase [Nocardia donostiensis]|uniref:Dithiol-disulfide isomerase n=1 Tax=Nocardia donostiensis TaxID=1538463 RepID=A0A1W0B0Z9_9NOCA|nr:DsbA family protein [Nocardia donostiensis]ONM48512.1 dithiol-disulfide isomerase [Nocardia donostiensis]OQS16101.1 dithiol-disulfide isomerase [Nocardia donostiensis]OQS19002.1 dithiol-disulfide isomerase [Nocardia donostiensis]
MVDVAQGTVVVYTDVACGWSTVALDRFYRRRRDVGLENAVLVDLRLFALEDVNRFPIPKRFLDTEIPVIGGLVPDFGWKPWQNDLTTWPNSTLLANEAVHAAKRQSLSAAEELDMAIRRAFFCDSRPIDLLFELLDIAQGCPLVDHDRLATDLSTGAARADMMRDYRAHRDQVQGSPHFFLVDGSSVHNPGIELHWVGEPGAGFPVVDSDDPEAIARLLDRAAQ